MSRSNNPRLTESEAARYLGGADFPVSTLRYWRCVGGGPRFLKLGRAVRYRVEDLDAFLERSLRCSTSDAAERADHGK